ncbi:MAG: hypothetical protein ACJA1U_003063 [Bermanella sp.]|jgi:hypothetical protein
MKYFSVFLVVLLALAAGYFFSQPTLIDTGLESPVALKPLTNNASPDNALQHSHDEHDHSSASAAKQHANLGEGKTGNPHFDQLSPEMQQAVKDSLLLEGPMETHTRADGVIVLPANGRFTQMPVAVEMPDGSIEIREYSVVPKASSSSAK